MLCVEDYIDALNWAKSLGGLKALFARADANAKAIADWVERTPWIDFLARAPETRSNTSVCLKVVDPAVAALQAGRPGRLRQGARELPREGKGRVRHRRLSRRAARLAHLVRRDRRDGRRRGADALARLRLRAREGQARQGGLSRRLVTPRKRGPIAASGHAADARLRGPDTDQQLSLSFSRPSRPPFQDNPHDSPRSHLRQAFPRRRRHLQGARRRGRRQARTSTRTSSPRSSATMTGSPFAPRPRSRRSCSSARRN